MINEVEHKLNAELMDRIRRIKHIALDMDGTIYNGNTLFPFTIAFLDKMKELGIGYSFLTNNPSKSTNDYLRHLSGMGIKAVKDEFYTSAQATIDYIRVHHPECKRLFLLGTPSMIKEFEEAGFDLLTTMLMMNRTQWLSVLTCHLFTRVYVVLRGGLIRRNSILPLIRIVCVLRISL